jgi:translation initiation factor 2 beta subunit (eIF-2beta)/eIF-5
MNRIPPSDDIAEEGKKKAYAIALKNRTKPKTEEEKSSIWDANLVSSAASELATTMKPINTSFEVSEKLTTLKENTIDPKLASFFLDNVGIIIKYLINKKTSPSYISFSLKEIATAIEKNQELKVLIKKIKDQLKSEQPNWALLAILKNKVRTIVNNYQK